MGRQESLGGDFVVAFFNDVVCVEVVFGDRDALSSPLVLASASVFW